MIQLLFCFVHEFKFYLRLGQEAFSELLIANGADLNVQNPDGLTPLEYATIKGNLYTIV